MEHGTMLPWLPCSRKCATAGQFSVPSDERRCGLSVDVCLSLYMIKCNDVIAKHVYMYILYAWALESSQN